MGNRIERRIFIRTIQPNLFADRPADQLPNVASQENDRTSILNYVRTLLEVRKNIPAIGTRGDWKAISDIEQPYPFAYMRWIGDEQYFIALNPSGKKRRQRQPAGQLKD